MDNKIIEQAVRNVLADDYDQPISEQSPVEEITDMTDYNLDGQYWTVRLEDGTEFKVVPSENREAVLAEYFEQLADDLGEDFYNDKVLEHVKAENDDVVEESGRFYYEDILKEWNGSGYDSNVIVGDRFLDELIEKSDGEDDILEALNPYLADGTGAIDDFEDATTEQIAEAINEGVLEFDYETAIDDMVNAYIENNPDSVQYVKDQFGEEEIAALVKSGTFSIDYDALAEAEIDGWGDAGAQLSRYDGEEHETSVGENDFYVYCDDI